MDPEQQEATEAPVGQPHDKMCEGRSGPDMRALYSQHLMQPEWLIDVPTALASGWCSPPWR